MQSSRSFVFLASAKVQRHNWFPNWDYRLLALPCLFLCIGLVSCSDVRDQDVAKYFETSRVAFERIAEIAISSNLSCQVEGAELQCNNRNVLPLFGQLHKNAGVNAIYVTKAVPELGNAVYFVMASYGLISTNS